MEKSFLLIIDGSSLLSTQFYGNLPREILFAKTQEEKEKYYYLTLLDNQEANLIEYTTLNKMMNVM